MGFNGFKRKMRNKELKDLNHEIQERKKLLFKWNNPEERRVMLSGSKIICRHPYRKVKRELAILHTIINERFLINRRLN